MEKRILVTGFEPFGGQRINPSWICAEMLPDRIEGATIIKKEAAVEWDTALYQLEGWLQEYKPHAILSIGQAGDIAKLNIERVAVNLCDGTDNKGVIKRDTSVFHGGPAAYFATLPHQRMLEAVKAAGVGVECSYSAGTFLCNCIMYGALHYAATRYPGLQAGFLHVPHLPQQVERGYSMPLEMMSKGVAICVEEIGKGIV